MTSLCGAGFPTISQIKDKMGLWGKVRVYDDAIMIFQHNIKRRMMESKNQ